LKFQMTISSLIKINANPTKPGVLSSGMICVDSLN
jgi:hypothetical protein